MYKVLSLDIFSSPKTDKGSRHSPESVLSVSLVFHGRKGDKMANHPNEKYRTLLNVNALPHDPVLDLRDKLVKMRKLQNKYNIKGGLDLLYRTIDAENEVDKIIFGKHEGYTKDDNRLREEKRFKTEQ